MPFLQPIVVLSTLVIGFVATYSTAEEQRIGTGFQSVASLFLFLLAILLIAAAIAYVNVLAANRRTRMLRANFGGYPLLHCGVELSLRTQIPQTLRARRERGTNLPFLTYEVSADVRGLSFWSGTFTPSMFFVIPWAEVTGIQVDHSSESIGVRGLLVFELEIDDEPFEISVRVDSPTARLVRGETLPRVRELAQQIAALSPTQTVTRSTRAR